MKSQIKKVQKAHRNSKWFENKYKTLAENIPEKIFVKDKKLVYVSCNVKFAKDIKIKPEEIYGKTDYDFFPKDLADKYRKDDKKILKTGKSLVIEEEYVVLSRNLHKEKRFYVQTIKTPIKDKKGKVVGILGVFRDITERKKLEQESKRQKRNLEKMVKERTLSLKAINSQLRKEISERKKTEETLRRVEERFKQVSEVSGDWIWEVDKKGLFTYSNSTVEKMLGYKPEEIVNKKHFYDFFAESDKKELKKKAFQIIRSKKSFKNFVNPNVHKDGSLVYLETSGLPVFDIKGKLIAYRGIDTNITEQKKANDRLQNLIVIDPQTGLYNYRHLKSTIESEFNRAKRYGQSFAIIMIDLDYFQSINDAYGRNFGDIVLCQFAEQLKKMIRPYDTIIRYSGEEFIILVPGIDRKDGRDMAERLLNAINVYNFGDKNHVVKLRLSMAVVSHPDDTMAKPFDLVETADKILRKAKEHGGNRVFTSIETKSKRSVSSKKADDSEIETLRRNIGRLTARANQSLIEAIFAFAKTIELKDHYTGSHVERTVSHAVKLARRLNLSDEDIERVRKAAILHDLGKVGISERILHKKSKLTRKEFEKIKKHPQIGVDIIRPIHQLQDIIPLVLYHHEWWNGKGYPHGLKGEEIPMGARIISIADAYQALTSKRSYRDAYSQEEAIKIIKDSAGEKFDPKVVNEFLKMMKK